MGQVGKKDLLGSTVLAEEQKIPNTWGKGAHSKGPFCREKAGKPGDSEKAGNRLPHCSVGTNRLFNNGIWLACLYGSGQKLRRHR